MNKKLIQTLCYVAVAAVVVGFSIRANMAEESEKDKFDASVKQMTESRESKEVSSSSEDTKDESDDEKSSEEKSSKEKASSEAKSKEKEKSAEEKSKSKEEKEKSSSSKEAAEEASSEETSSEASSEEQDESAEETGPYYSYRVTVDSGSLVMYDDPVNRNVIANLPPDYVGYVIENTEEHRSLILYQGMVGYCSNMYLEMTEITPEEYPDELAGLGTDDIGTTLFDGAAVGDIENSNEE